MFRISQLRRTLPPGEETQCHYLIWIHGFAIRLCEVMAFDMPRHIQIIAEYLAKSDLDQITAFILRNVALLPNQVVPELLKMGNVVYMNLISCEVGKKVVSS